MKTLSARLLLLLATVITASAFAAVPLTTNFQGYLTDPAGGPIHGMTNMTLSIYDSEGGGAPLWTDTLLVNVTQGLFTLQLGNDSNPLPATSFDAPTYIGIEVSSDGEMVPRRRLTTAPYAFRALDTETLGGLAAPDYVNVTGGQSISGSLGVLGGLTASGGIDLGGQGAVIDLVDMVFAQDSNGIQFGDGSVQSTNAVNSVLAADGSGSLLDADLLDGQHASEIIAAASDEISSPITNADLPLVISTPRPYFFAEALVYADPMSAAITIAANDVSIDLRGYSLTGPGGTAIDSIGINWNGESGITIENGVIAEFGGAAIVAALDTSARNRISNIQVVDNGLYGIVMNGSSRVENCMAEGNSEVGIAVGYSSQVVGNIARNNGIGINTIDANRIYGNVLTNNRLGLSIGSANTVQENVVNNNNPNDEPIGGGILASARNNILGNLLENNRIYGIFTLGEGAQIAGNRVVGTVGEALRITGGNLIDDNFIGQTTGTAISLPQTTPATAYRNNTIYDATTPISGGGIGELLDLGGNNIF